MLLLPTGALKFDTPLSDAYSASNILPDQKRGRPHILLPEWVELADSNQHFPYRKIDIQGVAVLLSSVLAYPLM